MWLFPEGQRSRDGKMGQAKLGVAIMALKSGSPIIPLAIRARSKLSLEKLNL